MNPLNPYESPATRSAISNWQLVDICVTGVWLSIPIGVFVGRLWLTPIFADFGVELPASTQLVIRLSTNVCLALVSAMLLLAVFSIQDIRKRRAVAYLACVAGAILGLACLLAFLLPLVALAQNLS